MTTVRRNWSIEQTGLPNPEGLSQLGITAAQVTAGRWDPQWDPLTIVHGDFQTPALNIPGVKNIEPGWSHHGGGGGGHVDPDFGNYYLELDQGNRSRTHNRLYVPQQAESITFDLWRSVTSTDDSFQVKLGDTVLATFALNQRDVDFRRVRAPIPAALTNQAHTLRLEIVQGGSNVESEVRIDNVRFNEPLNDDGVADGMTELGRWLRQLDRHGVLDQKLPLIDTSPREALAIADAVNRGVIQPTLKYLDENEVPSTWEELAQRIKQNLIEAGPADVRINPASVTVGVYDNPDGGEVRIDLVVEADRRLEDVPLNLGADAEQQDIRLAATATVDVDATLNFGFSFGYQLAKGLAPADAFFVRGGDLTSSLDVHSSNLGLTASVGFLDVGICNGTVNLDADLAVQFPLHNVTAAELASEPIDSLVTVQTSTAALNVMLPTCVTVGGYAVAGEAKINLVDADLFAAPGPALTTEGFGELLNFRNLDPRLVLGLLKQLHGWLGNFEGRSLGEIPVPFLKGVDFADVSELDDAFEDLLAQLEGPDGEPTFTSVQELGQRLLGGLGFDYNPITDELSYRLEFTQQADPTTVELDFQQDFGSLADLTTSSTASLQGSSTLELTFGIDLSPLPPDTTPDDPTDDGTFDKRFFIKDVTLSGDAQLAASDIDAAARFGFLSVEVASGSGSANGEVTVELIDPKTVSDDGRIDLFELWGGLSALETLATVDLSGSANFLLPLRVAEDFLGELHPDNPAVTIAWPDITSAATLVVTPNADMQALLDYEHLTFQFVIQKLREVESFIDEKIEQRDNPNALLNRKLPLVNKSVNDLVDLSDKFGEQIDKLEENEAETIQKVKDKLEEIFDDDPDDGEKKERVKSKDRSFDLELDFERTINKELPFDFDLQALVDELPANSPAKASLAGVANILDAGGVGTLLTELGVMIHLVAGIDVTAATAPFLYVYDDAQAQLEAKVAGDDLLFRAAVGPLGIYVGAPANEADVWLDGGLPSDRTKPFASRSPAVFTVELQDKPETSLVPQRYRFSELNIGLIEADLTGKAAANLPLYFPSQSAPLGGTTADNGPNGTPDGVPDNVLKAQVDLGGLVDQVPNSVSIVTPNINGEFGLIDLLANLGVVVEGLDLLLAGLQAGFDQQLFGKPLPLVGDQLKDAAAFLGLMREEFVAPLKDRLASQPAFDVLQQEIFAGLGPEGLNLLGDLDGDTDVDRDDVRVTIVRDASNQADRVQYDLRLHRRTEILSEGLGFDIGLPQLGLEVDGAVVVGLGFDFLFKFGVDRDAGFYFDTAAANELKIEVDARVPDLNATGRLAFLQLDVTDNAADPTHFTGTFTANVSDPNGDGRLTLTELASGPSFSQIVQGRLTAEAEVNLDLVASFGGSANFPSIAADFQLDWNFNSADTGAPAASFGDQPQIRFENVQLDVGSFFSRFATPILGKVQTVLKPIQPVIDILTTPLPVISDLLGEETTMVDLIELLYPDSELGFIEALAQTIDVINSIPTGSAIMLNLGRFEIGGDLRNPAVTPLVAAAQPATQQQIEGQLGTAEKRILDQDPRNRPRRHSVSDSDRPAVGVRSVRRPGCGLVCLCGAHAQGRFDLQPVVWSFDTSDSFVRPPHGQHWRERRLHLWLRHFRPAAVFRRRG